MATWRKLLLEGDLTSGGADSFTKLLIHSDTTDGSTTFVDSSASGDVITAYAQTSHQDTQKKFGSTAMYFDGGTGSSADYLELQSTSLLDITSNTQSFTLDLWVYPTSIATSGGGGAFRFTSLISKGAVYVSFGFESDGTIKFYTYDGAQHYNETSSGIMQTNEWQHLAYVSNAGVLAIYYNGVSKTLNSTTLVKPSQTGGQGIGVKPRIGHADANQTADGFVGYMDEYRISDGIARWTNDFKVPDRVYSSSSAFAIKDGSGEDGSAYFMQSVGIGTTSPDQLLHLKATDNKGIILIEDSEQTVAIGDITGGIWFQNDDAYGTDPHITATIEAVASDVYGSSDLVFSSSYVDVYPNKPTERMRILSETGNVGIGRTIPSTKLVVQGVYDASATASAVSGNTANKGIEILSEKAGGWGIDNTFGIDFGASSSLNETSHYKIASIYSAVESVPYGVAGQLKFYTSKGDNGSALEERMTIMANGNVGIGTSSPGERTGTTSNVLEVWNNYGTAFDSTDPAKYGAVMTIHNESNTAATGSTLLFTHRSESTGYAGITSLSSGQDRADLLFFTRNNTGGSPSANSIMERMRITETGEVGIGTGSNIDELLHIQGTSAYVQIESTAANGTAGVSIRNDARNWVLRTNGGDGDKFQLRDATADSQRLTVDSSGNVIIGNTSGNARLHVQGVDDATTLIVSSPLALTTDWNGIGFGIHGTRKAGIFFIRDSSYSVGRLKFCIDNTADTSSAGIDDASFEMNADKTVTFNHGVTFASTINSGAITSTGAIYGTTVGSSGNAYIQEGSGGHDNFLMLYGATGMNFHTWNGSSSAWTQALTFNASQNAVFAGHVGINGGGIDHPLEVAGGHIQLDDNRNLTWGDAYTAVSGNGTNTTGWVALVTSDIQRLKITGTGDILFKNHYITDEQGRQDHVANTMSQPYYHFDGLAQADRIDLGAAINFPVDDFTYSCWIYPDTLSVGHIGGNYGTGSTNGVQFTLNANGTFNCYIQAAVSSSTDHAISANTWNHVVYTRSGTTLSIYVNGVLSNSGTNANQIAVTGNWYVGNPYAAGNLNEAFDGSVSNVKVYNNALSAAEIKELYSGASVPFKYAQPGNYLDIDPNLATGWSSNGMGGATTGQSDPFGGSSAILRPVASGQSDAWMEASNKITHKVGETFRFSVWMKAASAKQIDIHLRGHNNEKSSTTCNVTTDWQQFSVERTFGDAGTNGDAIIGGYNTWETGEDIFFFNAIVERPGCVAEYDGSSAGSRYWQDKSDNNLDGTVTGATIENTAHQLTTQEGIDTNSFFSVYGKSYSKYIIQNTWNATYYDYMLIGCGGNTGVGAQRLRLSSGGTSGGGVFVESANFKVTDGSLYVTQTGAVDGMTITKSGYGNALKIVHSGAHNLFYIDNNSNAGNSAIYVENTGASGLAFLATSGRGADQGDPLIYGESTDAAFDKPILKLIQAGSVNALEVTGSSAFTGDITSQNISITKAGGSTFKMSDSYNTIAIRSVQNSVSSSDISFSTGTSDERMRITSAGRVGIGATAPEDLLHLYDLAGNPHTAIKFGLQTWTQYGRINYDGSPEALQIQSVSSTTSNSNGYITLETSQNGATPVERVRVDSLGKVGIGTDSPSSVLFVRSATDSSGLPSATNKGYLAATNDTTFGIVMGDVDYNVSPFTQYIQAMDGRLTVATAFPLALNPIGGNVGIGHTAPAAKLHIASGESNAAPVANGDELFIEGSGHTGLTICSETNKKAGIYFGDSGDADQGSIIYDNEGGTNSLAFTTDAGLALTLDASQNATFAGYIGSNTAPSANFHALSQGGQAEILLASENNATTSFSILRLQKSVASAGATTDGHCLGGLIYNGHNGSSYVNGVQIEAFQDGAISGSNVPAKLLIKVNNGSSLTTAVTINKDSSATFAGTLSCGANTLTCGTAQLNSGSYGGTINWGNYSYQQWTMQGSGVNSYILFRSWVSNAWQENVLFKNNGTTLFNKDATFGGDVDVTGEMTITGGAFSVGSSCLTLKGSWPFTYYYDEEVNQASWATYIDGNYFYIKYVSYANRDTANLNSVAVNSFRLGTAGLDIYGTITATSDITAYSDTRLKENISTIDSALDKVVKMRGVTYDRIDNGTSSAGVLADELESIAPELVHDGEYKSVAYGNLTSYLIEAIKELKQEVETLRATS